MFSWNVNFCKVDTHYRKVFLLLFYKKIKCDFLNFKGVHNGYHQDFQHLMGSVHFFMKWQR